ncbi:hypothetical protein KP806_24765 [Paenibacillus sp. N4]|uniref:hypothetical protein n=1 Tax=Paenibacillus vietnamensis TaxID=2590547 RepID=UPI001CD17C4E|nr:hypothetical protein [Paenibacillus vietnamensis]MCA0758272.1 hypothetical protein [Paenibacillus vietnamensis]
MTTKTATISQVHTGKSDVTRLVKAMTAIAWAVLGIGVLLCLINISHFSDKNVGLMVGLGFLVGSVHIYVIGTAIGLVHARLHQDGPQAPEDDSNSTT